MWRRAGAVQLDAGGAVGQRVACLEQRVPTQHEAVHFLKELLDYHHTHPHSHLHSAHADHLLLLRSGAEPIQDCRLGPLLAMTWSAQAHSRRSIDFAHLPERIQKRIL